MLYKWKYNSICHLFNDIIVYNKNTLREESYALKFNVLTRA